MERAATTDTADLTGYRAVHTALRRGTHALARAAAELDPADRDRVQAYARFWKGYAGEVLAHHTIEDQICFPALVARVPAAEGLIGRTDGDHHRLDELMDAAAAEVAELAAGRTAPNLAPVLAELAGLMDFHLDFEDAEILPLIERTFSRDEFSALEDEAAKLMGIGRQTAFAIPFVAAMSDPVVFEELLADAPKAFRVLYRLFRGRYARLERAALGSAVAELATA